MHYIIQGDYQVKSISVTSATCCVRASDSIVMALDLASALASTALASPGVYNKEIRSSARHDVDVF